MQYTVIRNSRRKRITLEILPDESLVVRAPAAATKSEIEDCVRENERWILQARQKLRAQRAQKRQQSPAPAADQLPPFRVVRNAQRRKLTLQIERDGSLTVRAPMYASGEEIRRFVGQNREWIAQAQQRTLERRAQEAPIQRLTDAQIRELGDQALSLIPERVRHFAPIVGVTYGRITIRNQRTRWGSCSSAGNLNFNCLLMLAPREVLDYVVVHELCHRLEMNHSAAFWAQVARVDPDYMAHRHWLDTEGTALMRRMTG